LGAADHAYPPRNDRERFGSGFRQSSRGILTSSAKPPSESLIATEQSRRTPG
jgi:hypothetical protein